MRKNTACVVAATWLLAACGGTERGGGARYFKSFEAEYYRVFYSMALTEAIAPGTPPDSAEAERIRERVRLTSWRWASSVQEDLVLRGTRFSFTFSEFSDSKPEGLLSDWVPVSRKRVYEGVFSQTGQEFRFTVERADGVAVPRAEVLEGVKTEGGGIALSGWREKGPFQGSILIPREPH